MADVLSLLLVMAILVAALGLMVRGARPRTGEGRSGAHRPRALRRYADPGLTGSVGLLVVALGGLATGSVTGDPSAGAGLGILVGVATHVSCRAAEIVLGLIGAAAALQAAVQVTSAGCWAVGATARWLTVGLVTLTFAATFLVGRHLPGNVRSTSVATAGLGLFAVLEVVAFLVSPLGVPIAASGPGAVTTSALAAAAFGLGSGYAPVLGPLLLGAAVSLIGGGASALVGQLCPGVPAAVALGTAVAFTAVAGTAVLIRRHVLSG
ncbi:hypothetical protein E4P40_10540 [Blastococcus sp. CT_GayMR20]|uniref:hypothetical protein n=1 Tax=Blastococcus sp. CT_GayMR20 TaxID=2559609 RepID=UPI001073445F|nr:hypothetical protein [Blastococcus sp. CT_GayMR20]TFV88059.1 hypothetical protein E4P40_10540 [Blastococcus sp. CT_GayMR20]